MFGEKKNTILSTTLIVKVRKYKNELDLIPEKQSYLGKLEREKGVLTNTYAYIRQKMEEARVSMASEPGKVRIINQAEEPKKPISPDIPKNIFMAIIIGAFIGFGCSIAIEYFDNTVKSVEFIERKKLPVLAIIPSIGSPSKTYSKKSNENGNDKSGIIKNGWKTAGTISGYSLIVQVLPN
mgnify:CR=1 FL=1